MAHDVFVSYSSQDQPTALAVVNALESNGIRCWMAPRDIRAGDVWAQAIVEAITGGPGLGAGLFGERQSVGARRQ